jgi:hypothetical protein
VKRVNDELGGVDGEDDSQQGLLTLASRWLVAHARITRLLAATHDDTPIKDKDKAKDSDTPIKHKAEQRDKQEAQAHEGQKVEQPPPSTLSSPPRLPKPPPQPPVPPSTNGHPLMGGGGRSALLAALSGGGLGSLKKKRPVTAPPPTPAEEEEEGAVEFERERGMFVSKLTRFLRDTDGRVGLVWTQGRGLQDRAQELYEYFGEDSVYVHMDMLYNHITHATCLPHLRWVGAVGVLWGGQRVSTIF